MIERILLSVLAFVLFAYIFIFKLIKKNDTTYLAILIGQAIGILLNFLQILFSAFSGLEWKIVVYILSIIIPTIILIIETKGISFSELVYINTSKILLIAKKRKQAKDILLKLVTKYDKSYGAHKMLAEIYEQEGGMRKAIDEYVKVLDIRGNDYKSYFKISQLLKELGRKNEAIQMLNTLVKKKPDLYEAGKMLRKPTYGKRKV